MPRHRLARCATALAVTAALSTTLTACELFNGPPDPPRPPGAFGLVVGHRSNMPAPQILPQASAAIDAAVQSQDVLTVVGVSGNPSPLYTQPLTGTCGSPQTCQTQWDQYRAVIDQVIGKVAATDPEANTLEAIAVAARAMAQTTGPKHILVVDSGLQTTGEMPLQGPGGLFVDPAVLARTLKDNGRLEKDLAGVTVTLSGLGSVRAPQPPLGQRARDNLTAIWTSVLQSAGATVDIVPAQLPDTDPGPGLPPVAVVPIDNVVQPTPCTRLREDQVGFLPNKSDFRDAEHARQVLEPIAKKIINENARVSLVGTTALPDTTGPGSLSDRRAQAVRDVLVDELNVPPSSVTTRGVATAFAGYRDPTAPDGIFKETVAIGDRLVIVGFPGARC